MDNINNIKTLTQQTKSVFIVINFPCKNGLYNLKAYNLKEFADDLSRCSFLYAFIVHDKDINDNGELKTVHIHLSLISDKRHQLKYYLYLISDLLGVNENLISVKPSNSDAGDLQYLVHKNNPDKYQYDSKDIIHNYSKDVFDDLMTRKIVNSIGAKELINLCRQYNKLELIEILGPARYSVLSKTINDIYKELRFEKIRAYQTNYLINNNKNNNNLSN